MAIFDSDVSLLSVEESDAPPLLFLFFFFVPLLDVVLRFLFFFVVVVLMVLLLLLLLIFLMAPLSPARRASVAANTTRPPEASPQSPRVTEEVGHDLIDLTHRDGIHVSDASVTLTRSTNKQTNKEETGSPHGHGGLLSVVSLCLFCRRHGGDVWNLDIQQGLLCNSHWEHAGFLCESVLGERIEMPDSNGWAGRWKDGRTDGRPRLNIWITKCGDLINPEPTNMANNPIRCSIELC